MSGAPTCRVCGSQHWSYEGHRFAASAKFDKEAHTIRKSPAGCSGCANLLKTIAALEKQIVELKKRNRVTVTTKPEGPKRDRAAYMRDYRATKKGADGGSASTTSR